MRSSINNLVPSIPNFFSYSKSKGKGAPNAEIMKTYSQKRVSEETFFLETSGC
jgi:hypothetical protein